MCHSLLALDAYHLMHIFLPLIHIISHLTPRYIFFSPYDNIKKEQETLDIKVSPPLKLQLSKG